MAIATGSKKTAGYSKASAWISCGKAMNTGPQSAGSSSVATACGKDDSGTTAGEQLDAAVDSAQEAASDAGEVISEAADDAGEAVSDAADAAGEMAEEASDAAGEIKAATGRAVARCRCCTPLPAMRKVHP